nr:hypothetical protein [Microaerobacter geothermalis]
MNVVTNKLKFVHYGCRSLTSFTNNLLSLIRKLIYLETSQWDLLAFNGMFSLLGLSNRYKYAILFTFISMVHP